MLTARPATESSANQVLFGVAVVPQGVSYIDLTGTTSTTTPTATAGLTVVHDGGEIGATLTVTRILIEPVSTTTGTYFDGTSTYPDEPLRHALWSGTPNQSPSVMETGVQAPEVWVSDFEGWEGLNVNAPISITATSAFMGMYSLLVPDATSAAREFTGLIIGDSYTFTAKARSAGTSGSGTISVGSITSGGGALTSIWTDVSVTFTAVNSAEWVYLSGAGDVLWDDITFNHHIPAKVASVPEKPRGLAPEYRYFTADLLTGDIIAEIPLRNVSYECALKAAGKFQGKIPITAETNSMELYNSTMPGNTAIYVMRNGKCVWGGIIWARDYDFKSKDLSVSASEFTSYFYHRKIWKTWNHQFGATLTYRHADNTPVTWETLRTNIALTPIASAGWATNNPVLYPVTVDTVVNSPTFNDTLRVDRSATGPDTNLASVMVGGTAWTNAGRPVVAPGDVLTVSIYGRANVTGWRYQLIVYYFDAAGTSVGSNAYSPTTTPTEFSGTEKWARLSFTTPPVPAGAVSAGIVAQVYTSGGLSTASDKVWFSDLLVEKTTELGRWFSGNGDNTPYGPDEDFDWLGATNASPSVQEIGVSVPLGWNVVLDNGSNVLPGGGSTVKLEFFEPGNMKYNGTYRVLQSPTPNSKGFYVVGGSDVVDVVSTEVKGGWYYYYTKENHGYATGDIVDVQLTAENGVAIPLDEGTNSGTVDAPDGPNSNWFRLDWFSEIRPLSPAEGVVYRPLPEGTYEDVTVTVRQDAYDYIRTLIDSTFKDFVGTDFPNVYIEPGISWALPVVSKQAIDGYAIIETEGPHGIAPGQAIQVQDVDGLFDGEYEVTDTPADNVIVYERGGAVGLTPVGPTTATISTVQMSNGIAQATTTANHGFSVGQNVTITLGDPYSDFSGTFPVLSIPTPTRFRYDTGTGKSFSSSTLPYAAVQIGSNPTNEIIRTEVNKYGVVGMQLKDPFVASYGQTLTVTGANRDLKIAEKALDAPNAKATIKTTEDHGLKVGDTLLLTGLMDYADIVAKSTTTTTVTMTTARPHNLRVGDSLTISGMDTHNIVNKALTSNVATLTTQVPHNTAVGATITVRDLYDNSAISRRSMVDNVATITTAGAHNFQVNDPITITGLTDQYTVSGKEAVAGIVTLTTSIPHNILVGSKLEVAGVGVPFDGTQIVVDEVTATRVTYKIDAAYWDEKKAAAARAGQNLQVPLNVPASKASGTLTNLDSFYNGQWHISARTGTTISFPLRGEDQPSTAASGQNAKVEGPSVFVGKYTVTARTDTTLSYARTGANVVSVAVPLATKEDEPQPSITLLSIHDGNRTLTGVTANTFTFAQAMPSVASQPVTLEGRKASIFNGGQTITEVPTTDRFCFSLPGYTANVLEESDTNPSYVRATLLYNGTYTVSGLDSANKMLYFVKNTLLPYPSKPMLSRGSASVDPVLVISSFGPFPGNADIDMQFSSRGYTGINLEPTAYRGFELKSVGEALDSYSDNINGFEYRIDCEFDEPNNRFMKKFVLIPINFPDPPPVGTVAPLSRYGADKLIFEYPGGNITNVSINESAENSATRFFAVGETDLGPEAGPNIGIASSQDLLTGKDGRRWPLLDASEGIAGTDDENELYAYAKRYLSEAAPPYTSLNVSLNGSIAPYVGEYKAGDWCALILDDPFMRMRLASELEPRTDVFVRKISSYSVQVPDGVTFPETVTLNLVAEWEVDTRG
jgi:hypothetical protein